ncbi:FkbM family methyltransferase [Methanobrevibacter sp.]|uniref:FkbM family methyltransferase n=1 Tax=Methanobrevibacter sp. TaxID=66852 RepID=UPI00386A58F9
MFKKFLFLLDYFKYIENPFDALKFKFGYVDTCNLKIKGSSKSINLVNVTSLNQLMRLIPIVSNNKIDDFLRYINDIDNDEKYLRINDISFINTFNSNFKKNKKYEYIIHLEEFFTDDEWDMVDFFGRHVIDIGGNIGDTSLFFAKKGAEVISFEPVKHLYDLSKENLKINTEYADKITLVNKGVGGKKGILTIESPTVKDYTDNDQYIMEIISIQDILDEYDFSPDILKMDCEGCEFEIILKNDLSIFNDIIFEHHSKITGKDYKLLIKTLENEGFKINTYPVIASKEKFEDIGIIHAFK